MDMSHPSPAFFAALRSGRPPEASWPAEWRGLAQLLAAAHAERRGADNDAADSARMASGSFDAGVARALAAGKANDDPYAAVNPFASSDGKPPDDSKMAHANTAPPATEG